MKTDNLLFIVLIAFIIDALLERMCLLSISNKTITGVWFNGQLFQRTV
jgi:hypothetical protein